MSEIDDAPQRSRGRSTTSIMMALIFLAVLGASAGLIAGTLHNAAGAASPGETSGSTGPDLGPTGTPSVTPSASPVRSASPSPSRSKSPSPTATEYPAPRRDDCPKQTDDFAGVNLGLMLYVRTVDKEAWICSGPRAGELYYQGHDLNTPFTAANSATTIFLRVQGTQEDGDPMYVASNDQTVYKAGCTRLLVERDDKIIYDKPAVDCYPG